MLFWQLSNYISERYFKFFYELDLDPDACGYETLVFVHNYNFFKRRN